MYLSKRERGISPPPSSMKGFWKPETQIYSLVLISQSLSLLISVSKSLIHSKTLLSISVLKSPLKALILLNWSLYTFTHTTRVVLYKNSHGIRARFIRTWLKLPHISHSYLSSNPSHEDSSIQFSFSMKKKTESLALVPGSSTFLIPVLMKSHVGSKGRWRGLANLTPKHLVQVFVASGYKKEDV